MWILTPATLSLLLITTKKEGTAVNRSAVIALGAIAKNNYFVTSLAKPKKCAQDLLSASSL